MMTISRVLLFVIVALLSLGVSNSETRQAHAQGLHSSQSSDLEHLFFLAGKGNVEAQFRIGLIYDLGQEMPQDYIQAKQWYEKAASGGLADANYLLGGMYELGHGVPLDYKKAVEYYEKAASKGQADAQLDLANIFFYGTEGIPKNYSRAAKWYEAAAQQGIVEAQKKIALMYEGVGLPKDYKKAKNWYEKAASQGDISAKASLGLMYSEGKGVERNFSKALEYLKPAANAGNWSAQFTLGAMYADGRGVPQDYVEAHKWFNILAAVGFEQVVESRNRLTKKMTPAQIAEAQRLASDFENQRKLPHGMRKLGANEKLVFEDTPPQANSHIRERSPDENIVLDESSKEINPSQITKESTVILDGREKNNPDDTGNAVFLILMLLQAFLMRVNWWVYYTFITQPKYNHPPIFWNPFVRVILVSGPFIGIALLMFLSFFVTSSPWWFISLSVIWWVFGSKFHKPKEGEN